MAAVTFITGNPDKAEFLAKFLSHPVAHQKLDLPEIQSLELSEVAEYKARQAYEQVGTPVLVEDAGLVIQAMGRLPGPYIKWFHHELGLAKICRLVDMLDSRQAKAAVCFCYFDGRRIELFEGAIDGEIAAEPKGSNGFGFDPIFIPNGKTKTLAQMSDEELSKYSLRTTTVYPMIKRFLENLN